MFSIDSLRWLRMEDRSERKAATLDIAKPTGEKF